MASKGRVPPTHFRHVSGSGVAHPAPYASSIRAPLSNFPPFDMLPPSEVMAQKLSVQHIEIEKLAIENCRLASTQGTLRHDLATANRDLHSVHAHIAEVNAEKEQQMRGMLEKMSAMDSELERPMSIKSELHKARGDAQGLLATRQELISKAQQLSRDLQMAHAEAQQIPSLMAELDGLRREYEHFRATYEYEKKLYSDHLESLQVMEKNYMAMSREVEKLRTELTSSKNCDPRTGGPYGAPYASSAGYNEGVPKGSYSSVQNAYNSIGQQGQSLHLGGGSGSGPTAQLGNSPYAPRPPIYDPAGAGYNTGHNYDSQKGPGYNGQNAPLHDLQRSSGDDVQRAANFDTQKGGVGPQGQVPMNNAPYGSTPSAGGYESVQQGLNPVRR